MKPYHKRNAEEVLRKYANTRLAEVRNGVDVKGETPKFYLDCGEYTAGEIDQMISHHFEDSEEINLIAVVSGDEVIRSFINSQLTQDAKVYDEEEPIIEVQGEPLTRKHIDEALTEHFGTNSE